MSSPASSIVPRPPRSRRSAGLFAALGAVLLAGCHTVGSTSWNLRELHGHDGSVQRVGRVMSAPEYQMRTLAGSIPGLSDGERAGPAAKRPRATRRPLDRALKELLRLERYSAREPLTAGIQVELQAWLALEADYLLVRERAVIGLGKQALRLGLSEPLQRADGRPGVGPEEVRAALEVVWNAAEARDFTALSAGLKDLEELDLDGQGARRALAGLHPVLAKSLPDPVRRAVEETHLELQRLTVAATLGSALEDPEGLVRAAALEGILGLEDAPRGELLRAALADRDNHVRRVVAADLGRGLPGGQTFEDWLGALLALASSRDGLVSMAACRTLSALAPEGPGTLRAEDWAVWAAERAEAAEASAREAALEAAAAPREDPLP